jgi:release factor glutamine methyltransferase
MTIDSALKIGYQNLKTNSSIDDYAYEAERILGFILKKSREFLLTHPELKITSSQAKLYKKLLQRRLNNWPLAYLTNQRSFYGLDFYVDKNALIPRPETEILVEDIIALAKNKKSATIIDIGTGSGAIIISLAKNLTGANYQFYGLDISIKALGVAKKNAKIQNLKNIKFHKSNLLSFILSHPKILEFSSDLIIAANLPYLTPAQVNNSPTIKKEPRLALVAGSDGLKYYRELFTQIKNLETLKNITIICEIDPSQDKSLSELAQNNWPKAQIQIKNDLAGLSRFVTIKM